MVMGNSTNSHVFNSAIPLKLRKFDARKIYMFCSGLNCDETKGSVLSPMRIQELATQGIHYYKCPHIESIFSLPAHNLASRKVWLRKD